MSLVLVHTDGSCWPNPGGPGGWACVIEMDGQRVELKGSHTGPTSNNRMEIQAAIEALKVLVGRKEVLIHTDSKYLRNAAVSWIKLWKKRGWVTSEGGPVKNRDLWEELDALMLRHDVKWKWVKAHNTNYNENNRCDALANNERLRVERDHLSNLILNHEADSDALAEQLREGV